MKHTLLFTFYLLFFTSSLQAVQNNKYIDSQPEILFNYNTIKKGQEKLKLQVEFNKAVLLLNKQEYVKAIEILEKTAKILKVPSFLNIGIAYYKIGSKYNAKLYFDRIYNFKEAIYDHTYSYMSACYYLFKITEDYNYLETIVNIGAKHKKLSEHAKRLMADTYILRGEYKNAIDILDKMDFALDLKKAILHLKIRDYVKAEILLEKAKSAAVNKNTLNKILWLLTFRDLKMNNLKKLNEHLDEINNIRTTFRTNLELPLKIFFNPNKFTSQEYLQMATKFEVNRKIDFIFYFAPFVFSDNDEIFYDSSKGFIFKSKQNLESLEEMVEYNANFLEVIKKDPIIRVVELKKLLNKDTKSYVYYNLALSYAQISDFHNAFHYFKTAYNLNPGNKMFAAMTLICAKRINADLDDKNYIEQNILLKGGQYNYFGQELFKMFINPKLKIKIEDAPLKYKKTIFYKALQVLLEMDEKGIDNDAPLIKEHFKDPLVYLMRLVIRKEGESDYQYFSRMQDEIPLIHNDNFLSGPVIITNYYVDLLKSLGLFNKANLELSGNLTPSYLRTKALRLLHSGEPLKAVKILEKLQVQYKLEDKYTLYMIVAGYLRAGMYNDASLQISLIKGLLKDDGADFLTGVQLIQDLKISSAKQFFKYPYKDSLIDFELEGLDEFLESL